MSKLTDFLHKLVDQVGASSLHEAVDDIETDAAPAKSEDETEGKEDSSNAAE